MAMLVLTMDPKMAGGDIAVSIFPQYGEEEGRGYEATSVFVPLVGRPPRRR